MGKDEYDKSHQENRGSKGVDKNRLFRDKGKDQNLYGKNIAKR